MMRALSALLAAGLFATIAGWTWMWATFERSPAPGVRAPARPATLDVAPDVVTAVLEAAPWVSPPGMDASEGEAAPVLWVVGWRRSDLWRFGAGEAEALEAVGVDVRIIAVPQLSGLSDDPATSGEAATLAQLALSRDWDVFAAWTAQADPQNYSARISHPPVTGDAAREAVLAQVSATREALAGIVHDAGWGLASPALFWRDGEGRWRVFMGDARRGARAAGFALGVSE